MNVAASADASAPCGGGGGDLEDLLPPGDVVGVVDSVRSLAPFADAGERALHYENDSVEDIYKRWDDLVKPEDMDGFQRMVLGLLDAGVPGSERALAAALAPLRKKYKLAPRKAQLLHAYRSLLSTGHLDKRCVPLEEVLTTKASKSQSGVLVVTVLTSPYPSVAGGKKQRFSCKWNCYYCPNEPGQPRSYLRDEPAVLRANQNQFDAVMQFTERCATLAQNGHPVDKVELLVLGGTWASYPLEYREAFCRDLYYAANTFWQRADKRPRRSLLEEQTLNESAATKIIGLTLETRPDTIDEDEIRLLRSYGCTRVQLGVQHVDAAVLDRVNRGHGRAETATALRLLKDACYKVDIHLMPNLPGATPAVDLAMFDAVLYDEDLQADQWKIYPCEVTPWTVIKKWFDEGSYVPYAEDALVELLMDVKSRVHPWIRLNRVVRDIPSNYILGGVDAPNLREDILVAMRRRGLRCKCIRCREVGDIGGLNQLGEKHGARDANRGGEGLAETKGAKGRMTKSQRRASRKGGEKARAKNLGRSRANRDGVLARRSGEKLVRGAVLTRRFYRASGGDEHFLSFETRDQHTIFGFVRLRLPDSKAAPAAAFESLRDCALIRELHVYGQLAPAATKSTRLASRLFDSQQHRGFGRRLMEDAEAIAAHAGFRKIAVIAGIGTRDYYRRMGYVLVPDGGYLIKDLATPPFFAKLALAYVAILAFAVAVVVCGGDADGATPLRGLVLR
jgi:ELP3 family radical SAM enzyme/protein acetyltransferase